MWEGMRVGHGRHGGGACEGVFGGAWGGMWVGRMGGYGSGVWGRREE